MWTWRERSGRCCRSQGMPEMARQSPEGGRQVWNWLPITALEKNHSADPLIWGFQVPTTLWLKVPHLWCPGRQPQEANPGGNTILCNDVLCSSLPNSSPCPAPGTLADSCSSSFFEILKSTRVCWFVNKHHKLGFDSSFPCLFRQKVGKKQPVGQTRAPSCFCKSFSGTGLCSFVDLFSVAAVTLEGQVWLTKLAKFITCPFRGEVCSPLACTWESNAGNVKNTDKT